MASWKEWPTHAIASSNLTSLYTNEDNTYVRTSLAYGPNASTEDYQGDFTYDLNDSLEFANGAVTFLTYQAGAPSPTPTPSPDPSATPSPSPSPVPDIVEITWSNLPSGDYWTEQPVLHGTATSAVSNVTGVEISGLTDGAALDTTQATADDGTFNEISEDFTLEVPLLTNTFDVTITVTNAGGQSQEYYYQGYVDTTLPTFNVTNIGLEPRADTTPTWTASASDNASGVAKFEYAIYHGNTYDVPWTEVSPDDGESGGASEDYAFTSANELSDGVKFLAVRVTDGAGNITFDDGSQSGQATIITVDRITIEANDTLGNPVEANVPVQIELRKTDDNSSISFSPSSATVEGGTVTITGNVPSEEGNYRVYVSSDEASAYSSVIQVAAASEPADNDDDSDDDSGSSDHHNPSIGIHSSETEISEPMSVFINWSAKNVDTVELRSQYTDYGNVERGGGRTIWVDKDTTFWVTGKGPYGEVSASTRVKYTPAGSTGTTGSTGSAGDQDSPLEETDEDGKPVIQDFTVTQASDDPTLVTVEWHVTGADYIEIAPIGGPLAAQGSQQLHLMEEESDLVLLARNASGEVTQTRHVSLASSQIAQRQQTLDDIAQQQAQAQSTQSWWQGWAWVLWGLPLLLLALLAFFLAQKKKKSSTQSYIKH